MAFSDQLLPWSRQIPAGSLRLHPRPLRRRAQQPRKTSARQAGRKEIDRVLRDLAAQHNSPQ